jgi:CheY-like chemotaxis protein
MSSKRALVVDDSKSARAFLSRLLEGHSLEVDAAETAEQAIDYLTRHRPDVIFMDHLMPGMDGFQAVQAIKNNPRTATIPILMYTSQEGELYLGQARALGAMGVLPKQVAPTDVSKVLQQLRLIEGKDTAAQTASEEIGADEIVALSQLVSSTASRPALEPETFVRDQIAELRRFLVVSLDQQSERILEDVKAMIGEAAAPPVVVETPPPPRTVLPWVAALAASLVAVTLAALLWREHQVRSELQAERAGQAASLRIAKPAALVGAEAIAPLPFKTSVAELTVLPVPYGESPLSGSRVDQLRRVVATLSADGFKGTLEVRRYPGRFCLAGNGNEGYSLAEGSLPYLQCDLVADANDAALGVQQAESLAFANALAELRKTYGNIVIDVAEGNAISVQRGYPEVGGTPPKVPTAAEWNAAAISNNRVELHWRSST